jgi:hypothetical protein
VTSYVLIASLQVGLQPDVPESLLISSSNPAICLRLRDSVYKVMEIFPRPVKPTGEPPRCLVAEHARYDGLPFLGYPDRNKLSWLLEFPVVGSDMQSLAAQYGGTTPEEASFSILFPFLQTWLYFGLLAEGFAIACATSTKEHEYVKEVNFAIQWATPWVYSEFVSEDGHLSTANFSILVEKYWLTPVLDQSITLIKKKYHHLCEILDRTGKVLCMVKFAPFTRPDQEWDWLQLHAIFEGFKCVTAAITFSYPLITSQGIGSENKAAFPDVKLMRDHGWCISDMYRSRFRYPSWQTKLFLGFMEKPLPISGRKHVDCRQDECVAIHTPESSFPFYHVNELCKGDCDWIGPDPEVVRSIVMKTGSLPILQITATSIHNIDIKVLEYPKDTKAFISVSHVWIDGLGNPNECKQYRCQLYQLWKEALAIIPESWRGSTVLLWLDTLCCPTVPKDDPEQKKRQWIIAKARAIEKLPLVYQTASAVLVRDSGLSQFIVQEWLLKEWQLEEVQQYTASRAEFEAKAIHIFELTLRIMNCNWMRRLWTLQEVALSENAIFQFGNGAVSRHTLDNWLAAISQRSFAFNGITCDLMRDLVYINPAYRTLEFQTPIRQLYHLNRELSYRSVSVVSDEALCMTTLMGLDLSEVATIVAQPEEFQKSAEEADRNLQVSRMKKFWTLMATKHGVPYSYVLDPIRAIDCYGYRWAPVSILKGPEFISTRSLVNKGPAFLQPNFGLQIQLPGFRLKPKTGIAARIVSHGPYWQKSKRVLEKVFIFRDSKGRWFSILNQEAIGQETPLKDLAYEDRLTLVCESQETNLVSSAVIRCENEIGPDPPSIKGEIIHRVTVSQLRPERSHLNSKMHELAVTLESDQDVVEMANMTKAPDDQNWRDVVTKVIKKSKAILNEALIEDSAFQEQIAQQYYPDLKGAEDYILWMWIHTYQGCEAEILPESQIWYVN